MKQPVSQGSSYRWWVFGTIAVGTFLSVMDQGSVLLALPTIETQFKADLPRVQWIMLSYALAISVLLLPMGRLADMVGRRRVYITGFIIFVSAAGLAGISLNLPMLIGARVLQGIGSAMIQGTALAMLISVFPSAERGKVLGANLSAVGLGLVAGPAFGGLLVSTWGWRSIFLVDVLVGLVTIAAAVRILYGRRFPQEAPPEKRTTFDLPGAILSGAALFFLLLTVGNGYRWGWTSAPALAGVLAAVILLTVFIWWELRHPSPMLELRLFQRRLVAMGVAAGWISFMASISMWAMMPFYLQKVLGYSPSQSGLVAVAPSVGLIIMGSVSGRLSDRLGWRTFNIGGQILSATALFVLAFSLTEQSSLALVIPFWMLMACGQGLFNAPNNSSILSAVERSRYGVVSALTQLNRNMSNVTSIAVTTSIVAATMASRGFEPSLDAVSAEGGAAVSRAFIDGWQRAMLLMGTLVVMAIGLSMAKGERVKEEEEPVSQPVSQNVPRLQ